MTAPKRYTIEYHRDAAKDIRSLHPKVRKQVLADIGALADNPRPHGVTKMKGYDITYRVRIGEYRVMYEVEDDVLTVYVVEVKPRGSAYRKF